MAAPMRLLVQNRWLCEFSHAVWRENRGPRLLAIGSMPILESFDHEHWHEVRGSMCLCVGQARSFWCSSRPPADTLQQHHRKRVLQASRSGYITTEMMVDLGFTSPTDVNFRWTPLSGTCGTTP
jgi:hypothetical protein